MKKRIGLSRTSTNFHHYWNWLQEEEEQGLIERVLLSEESGTMETISSCDGYLLTGGIDLQPALYDGQKSYPNQPEVYEPKRDLFETGIYQYARTSKKPLLAICRGMQLMHVLEGGRLIQDLGSANSIHKKDTAEDKQHAVELINGTRLFKWAGQTSGQVNSAHHQALDPATLATCLKIAARSTDGIIEGIELNQEVHPFIIGIQWHPERMLDKSTNPLSQSIKENFLANTLS